MNRILLTLTILIACQYVNAQNILTLNGYVPESELHAGDQVIGYDNDQIVINTVLERRLMTKEFYSQQNESFDYFIINDKYKFFAGQSIYANDNVIHVSELKTGDEIYDEHNKKISVTKIQPRENEYRWFRFIVSGNHSYINNGILVHNASRFWKGGGSSQNWGATSNTNWSATSGGSNNASVPTSSDDVNFDANGNSNSTTGSSFTILSLTITSGYTSTLTFNTAILTVAGNVTLGANMTIAGTGALGISATSTITSNGKTWPNAMTFTGAGAVKTIVGNLVLNGLLTITTNAQVINHNASETLTCGGLSTTAACSGTCDLIMNAGTWSGSVAVQNNLTLTGTITVTNAFYNTGTLTNSGATVTATGTLTLATAAILNTSGITWNNVTCPTNNSTITLNSALTCAGTLLISGINVTFAGSAAFSVNALSATQTQASVITLVHGLTYTVTNSLSCNLSRTGSIVSFTSDDATIKAILTLQPGASCNVLAAFTRIDASNGRTINTFNGTVTNCININSFGATKTISQAFIQ